MMVFGKKLNILAGITAAVMLFSGWASAPEKYPDLGLSPLQESPAYKNFKKRPSSEYSKVIFLIDRFKNLPHEVVYDGIRYKIKNVSGLVSAFLRMKYRKSGSARDWVLQYAHRSLVRGEVILLRHTNGKIYRAGDILLRELDALEQLCAEESPMKLQAEAIAQQIEAVTSQDVPVLIPSERIDASASPVRTPAVR